MPMSFTELNRFNPFSKPEGRWERAQALIDAGRPFDRQIDDAWVGYAYTVLSRRPRSAKTKAIVAARDVWTGDSTERGKLEAWLLTTEPLDRVAERCGLPVAVVQAYCEVFFDVRQSLKASDWILRSAVGFSPLTGFSGPQPMGTWKLVAYQGGPFVLELVIEATTGSPVSMESLGGGGRPIERERRLLHARLLADAMVATTDEEMARVVRERRQLRDLEIRRGWITASVDPSTKAMEQFTMALPRMKLKTRSGKRREEVLTNLGLAASRPRSCLEDLRDTYGLPLRPSSAGRRGSEEGNDS